VSGLYANGAITGIPAFEPDGHPASQHTAQGFADNALTYIKAMKAADPSIRIGIPIIATPETNSPEYAWDVTSGDAAVNAHAAVRPDGSLVILAVNTDPAKAKSVRLIVAGYRAAAAIAVRSYGAASHGIGRSRATAGGVISLAPSSLTELVLRPAGAR